ncbi:MAG: hypothetical protein ACRDAW_02420 [Metamycoplasmataceae bacterium]
MNKKILWSLPLIPTLGLVAASAVSCSSDQGPGNVASVGRTLKIANDDTYKNQAKEMIFGKGKPITREAFNNFVDFTAEEQQLLVDFTKFIEGKISITQEELKNYYSSSFSWWRNNHYLNNDDCISFWNFWDNKVNQFISQNTKWNSIFKMENGNLIMLIRNPNNPAEIMGKMAADNYIKIRDYKFLTNETITLMKNPLNWKQAPQLSKKEIQINNINQSLERTIYKQDNVSFFATNKYELALIVLGILLPDITTTSEPNTNTFTMLPLIENVGMPKLSNIVKFKDHMNPIVELSFSGTIDQKPFTKTKEVRDIMGRINQIDINILNISLNNDGTDKVLTQAEWNEIDKLKNEKLLMETEIKKINNDPNSYIQNLGINSITNGPILIGNFNYYNIEEISPGTPLPFGTVLTNESTSEQVFEAIKNNITIDGKTPTTSPSDIVWTAKVDATGEITVTYTSKDSVFIGQYALIWFTVATTPSVPY